MSDRGTLQQFGNTAAGLSRNPLGIIALFIVLVYGLASLVIIMGSSLAPEERVVLIYFLAVFPVIVLAVFAYLVAFRAGQLFAPSDFKREETYLELQRMQLAAVASLTAAKRTKDSDRTPIDDREIDGVVASVESAVHLAQEGTKNPLVLWVDENPDNNLYERRAFESVGVRFILSETTEDALTLIKKARFDAIISNMGRREGPREGYKLLDGLRSRGDQTPLFFYVSSNQPEHKRETYEHGGQGCTNDGQELFDMVTKSVFSPKPMDRSANTSKSRTRVK